MPNFKFNVFINCPFDVEFRPLFEAIYFTIAACSYSPRCALEDTNGLDVRLGKLCNIVRECPKSVHDLSRTAVNDQGLPRFNMPFELGLVMGAKSFGGRGQRGKTALILVEEPYKMPAYISDLGGNDPVPHARDADKVVRAVRDYLHERPKGGPLPGPKRLRDALGDFQGSLPGMAAELELEAEDCDAFDHFKNYAHFVAAYLKNKPVV